MTPIQTFGATQAPSNMMFPTAAYLQASQNAAETRARGMEAMGKGIASGISSVAGAYKEYKDEQAKFDATKKVFKAFGGDLSEDARKEIDSIFADTSMSVREKNALTPALMQYLGASQQQKGRERVAEIMSQGRVDAAGARRPTPMTGSSFGGVPTLDSIFNLPANPSQGNPAPLQEQPSAQPGTQSGQPASRIGVNGQMEVWSSRLGKYVELDNPMQDIQY